MNEASTASGESQSTVDWKAALSENGRKPQYQIEFVEMSARRSCWNAIDARQPS